MSIEEISVFVFSIIDPEGTYTIIEQDIIWDKSSLTKLWKRNDTKNR